MSYSIAHRGAPARTSTVPDWVVWLGFVLLCNGAGFLSSLAGQAQTVYSDLRQPSFAPPSWVFAPVWTALYTMMGTATYLVWKHCTGAPRRTAMTAFGVQLALNVAWTPVFFGLQQYAAALALLVAIWAAVGVMTVVYFRRVKLAGALVAPLWAWVTFAGVLNAAIVSLN